MSTSTGTVWAPNQGIGVAPAQGEQFIPTDMAPTDYAATSFGQNALSKLVQLSSVIEDLFENEFSIAPKIQSDYNGCGFRCEVAENKLWMHPENRVVYTQPLLESNVMDEAAFDATGEALKESTQVIAVMRMLFGTAVFRSNPSAYSPMNIHRPPKEPSDHQREYLRQVAKQIVAGEELGQDVLPKLALMKFSPDAD